MELKTELPFMDIMKFENEFTLDGVMFQKFIRVLCIIDIPLNILINKLKTLDNNLKNELIECLKVDNYVIKKWIEKKSNKNLSIDDYINFLNSYTEKDFIRIHISDFVRGVYIRYLNNKYRPKIGLDQKYIELYDCFIKKFNFGEVEFKIDYDLNKIPSNEIRPLFLYFNDNDDNCDYEIHFLKGSFILY